MEARIVRKCDLPKIIGLGRTAIEEAIERQDFPRAIRLGKRAVGFSLAEIDAWIANRDRVERDTKRSAKRDTAK